MLKKIAFVLVFIMAGCVGNPETQKPVVVTATPDILATIVGEPTIPVADTKVNVSLTDPTATPEQLEITCFTSERPVTQYEVNAALDWETKIVRVAEKVTYANLQPVDLQTLVFQVEANREPNIFFLQGVSFIEGKNTDEVVLNGSRLTVPLPEALPENCQIALTINFELRLPVIADGFAAGRLGYFGYTGRQVNLGHWFPTVAIYNRGLEWYTPAPSPLGEQNLAESSDFKAMLKLENAPDDIDVAGPGSVRFLGENTWEFGLKSGRDLALSIGRGFQRLSQLTDTGKVIEVYSLSDNSQNDTASNHVLQATVQAVALYEELFGVIYPYSRLVIVEGDFPDGMEFSGLAFVSEAWFRVWNRQPNDWLTVITVHEVAHQWWYALIGNDPATYPYLDEAFATYSEYLFFERYYPDQTSWWWDFRVNRHVLSGNVDSNVYQYGEVRPYINAVYLRGAQMLHTTRTELGDEAFFDWLMSYASTYQHQIATPKDLWSKMPSDEYAKTELIRQQFFQDWNVAK